jgi:hypothetical protein
VLDDVDHEESVQVEDEKLRVHQDHETLVINEL